MNNFTGRLYRKTALRNGDRRAGIGVAEDDSGDESFPRAKDHRTRRKGPGMDATPRAAKNGRRW